MWLFITPAVVSLYCHSCGVAGGQGGQRCILATRWWPLRAYAAAYPKLAPFIKVGFVELFDQVE